MQNTYFLSIKLAPSNKISDLESNLFAISQVLKVNWILPQQNDKILDVESELKIEREWRQQLEAASHQDKETIFKMKEEMVYLLKVASVSTVMIWKLNTWILPQNRTSVNTWNFRITRLVNVPNLSKVISVSTVIIWKPDTWMPETSE